MKDKLTSSNQQVSIGLLVVGMLFAIYCYNKPLGDFANYYFGSKLLLSGVNVWTEVYNIANFNKSILESGYTGLFLSHTSVAPQSLLFYIPLALIPDPYLAKCLFNIAGLLSLCAVLYTIPREHSISLGKGIMLGLLFLPVLYFNIVFGQTYVFVAAILLFIVLYSDKHPRFSALLLAIAISIKISPFILLFYFIIKRQYRFVVTTLLFTTLIFLLSIVLVGVETMNNFYLHILPKLLNGFVNDPYSASYHSIVVLLRKLFLHDELLNPHVITNLSLHTISLIALFFNAIVLFFIVTIVASKKISKSIAFFLLLLLINISSGYTTTYGLMMLFPLLLFMDVYTSKVLVIAMVLICWLPPLLLQNYNPFLMYFKLYLFLIVLGSLLLQHFEKGNYKVAALTTSLFVIFSLIKISSTNTRPLPYYNVEVYHHDYILEATVVGSHLNYTYFDRTGFHQAIATQKLQLDTGAEKDAKKETKLKFLTDGTQVSEVIRLQDSVVFLSDYNRGPGLFNLYVLPKKQFGQLENE